MPDIDFQRIELNLIPKKGEQPVVFYASQYETARPFIADLKWGNTEFAPGDDCWAEIDIRKNDDNLVVITDDVTIDNNEVSVILPVQALTCIGKNLGQVKIYAADDQLIAALNFILEVQADPSAGGVTSETAIDNLTQQIEDIAQEVIGDDYYNKTEVDTLLADKADVSDLPDMSLYYTKTATDTLLNAKADKSDTYTKAQVDSALAAKANSADLSTVATSGDYDDLINKPTIPAAQIQSDYTQADTTALDYIKNKPDISGMIADALLAVMPVETVGPSAVCNFNTDIATNLVNVKCTIEASGGGGTPSTPIPIVGYSAVNLTHCGVNLLSATPTFEQGASFSDGVLSLPNAYSAARWVMNNLPQGQYTFSVDFTENPSGSTGFIQAQSMNGTSVDQRQYKSGVTGIAQVTFTITDQTTFRFAVISSNITGGTIKATKFLLNKGDSVLPYAPYNGTTDTIAFEV